MRRASGARKANARRDDGDLVYRVAETHAVAIWTAMRGIDTDAHIRRGMVQLALEHTAQLGSLYGQLEALLQDVQQQEGGERRAV